MGSFLYLVCYTFCTLLSLNSSFLLLTNKLHPSPALLKSLLRPCSYIPTAGKSIHVSTPIFTKPTTGEGTENTSATCKPSSVVHCSTRTFSPVTSALFNIRNPPWTAVCVSFSSAASHVRQLCNSAIKLCSTAVLSSAVYGATTTAPPSVPPAPSLTSRGRPIIGADIKHFTDYRYRPF